MQFKFMEESSHIRPPGKRTSRCWNIRLTMAPHWVEILLEQGVKTNTWTQRQDTWHFKAILLRGPSSLGPVWHGVSLTPIMKSKSNCLPGHSFLLQLSFPILPLKNTWVPLLFYCLSTPLKLNVRPSYQAYTSPVTLVLYMANSLWNKSDSGRYLDWGVSDGWHVIRHSWYWWQIIRNYCISSFSSVLVSEKT